MLKCRLLLLLVAAAAACHEPPPPPAAGAARPAPAGGAPERVWSFEDAALSADFAAEETNSKGAPGRWESAADPAAPDGARVLRLADTRNAGSTFNLFLSRDGFPADMDLSVRLRADRGAEDQGGGLAWRARDAQNYWCARWNPLEDNIRLDVVENGRRRTLDDVRLAADPRAWHELRVQARGPQIVVLFDGVERLHASDAALPEGGRLGLWTKADAASSFDLLRFAVLAPPQGAIPGPEPR